MPARLRGPLADSYPAAVGLVSFALIPYLALTSAMAPLTPVLTRSLAAILLLGRLRVSSDLERV